MIVIDLGHIPHLGGWFSFLSGSSLQDCSSKSVYPFVNWQLLSSMVCERTNGSHGYVPNTEPHLLQSRSFCPMKYAGFYVGDSNTLSLWKLVLAEALWKE